jgi:hypothetical protein
MSALLQDLRYAGRMLVKSPGFAAIAILTLALGIAADTTLFSVVNGVLLNPLAYPHSGELVSINANESVPQIPVSYLNFLDWQRQTRTLSSMAMYRHEDYNLTGQHGPAQRVNGFMVSALFLSTLGVPPALGRDFNASDDHLGAAPVALLSDGFWRRRFGDRSRFSASPSRSMARTTPSSAYCLGVFSSMASTGMCTSPSASGPIPRSAIAASMKAPTWSRASPPASRSPKRRPIWTPSPTTSPRISRPNQSSDGTGTL